MDQDTDWGIVAHWLAWFDEAMADATPAAFVRKFAEEAGEFVDSPSLEEAVDAFGCLIAWAHRSGHTQAEFLDTLRDKLAVNKQRAWQRQSDGTYKHTS